MKAFFIAISLYIITVFNAQADIKVYADFTRTIYSQESPGKRALFFNFDTILEALPWLGSTLSTSGGGGGDPTSPNGMSKTLARRWFQSNVMYAVYKTQSGAVVVGYRMSKEENKKYERVVIADYDEILPSKEPWIAYDITFVLMKQLSDNFLLANNAYQYWEWIPFESPTCGRHGKWLHPFQDHLSLLHPMMRPVFNTTLYRVGIIGISR